MSKDEARLLSLTDITEFDMIRETKENGPLNNE